MRIDALQLYGFRMHWLFPERKEPGDGRKPPSVHIWPRLCTLLMNSDYGRDAATTHTPPCFALIAARTMKSFRGRTPYKFQITDIQYASV